MSRTKAWKAVGIAVGVALGVVHGGCGARAGASRPSTTVEETARAISARSSASTERRARPIEAVRARTAGTTDPAALRELAAWELLGSGGDPEAAAAAIARGLAAAPDDAGLHYLAGLAAIDRGDADVAVDAFVAALQAVPDTSEPWASALARSALAFLDDARLDASNFEARVVPALEALHAVRSRLPAPLARTVAIRLRNEVARTGNVARVAQIERELGFPTVARVAGPFGFTALGGFDVRLPAEGPGPMADRYDLGPGRQAVPTRRVEATHGSVSLAGRERGTTGPGTRVVEATLHAEHAGSYVLGLEAPGSLRVSIDGREVAVVDRRRVEAGRVAFVAVELTAGDHELEVKIASRSASTLAWSFFASGPGSLEPSPAARGDLFARFLEVEERFVRGEVVASREAVRTLITEDSPTVLLLTAAGVLGSDPFVGATQREDLERALVERAAQRDPRSLRAALRRAALVSGEQERIDALRDVRTRFPRSRAVAFALRGALDEAGYTADAQAVLDELVAAYPEDCTVAAARFDAEIERSRLGEARGLVPLLERCDARERSGLTLAMAARRWSEAEAEIARIEPLVEREEARALRLSLARSRGDEARARALRDELEAEALEGSLAVVRADRAYARGDRAAALEMIEREAARSPDEAHDLRSLSFALSGRDVMEPYREDGRAFVRAFEASGHRYDGFASVLVFDYMAVRVLESGRSIVLTHQIYRVQSQEGVERFAELHLPGRVLTVRVLRPDGTFREPNDVEGDIAMPPLEVGDYVEYEYVHETSAVYGDAYVFGGWHFQDHQSPYEHSEIVFVAPPSLPLEFETEGPVPPPSVRVVDGLRETRYLVTQAQPLPTEAHSVPLPPVIPALRASVRATWGRFWEAIVDRLSDGDAADPATGRLLESIHAGPDVPVVQRVQRIHRWVVDSVEQTDGLFGEAAVMLGARRGNRSRVLRYLLEAAGIPAVLALVRPLGAPEAGPTAVTSPYGELLVGADLDGEGPRGRTWMTTAFRGAAFDQLSDLLLGQEAVLLDASHTAFRLPATQGEPNSTHIEVGLEIGARGDSSVRVRWESRGGSAARLRAAFAEVPRAERARVVAERLAPSVIAGMVVAPANVRIEGEDDWNAPFVVSFQGTSNSLFAPVGEGASFRMVPLFANDLMESFAALPSRTTSELVTGLRQDLRLTVRGPGRLEGPSPRTVRGPNGGTALIESSSPAPSTLVVHRRIDVPASVVPAASYGAFAEFCRAASQLELETFTIRLR